MSAHVQLEVPEDADLTVPIRALLTWPPHESSLLHIVQAFVILRRPGGLMLVLPENVIEPASLQPFSVVPEDGTEPLVGPVRNFVVPLMLSQDDGGLERSEEMVGVQVIDMSLPGALNILSAYPEDGEDMDLVSNFSHLDINARPSFGDLLPMVVAWIGEETEERLAFYTADEGPQSSASPPKAKAKAPHTLPDGSTAPGKAKSAAKKPTVATLSQQMETVLAALPMITDQLSALTMKQDMLERQQRSAPSDQPGFRPIAAGKSAQPISSLLRGTPKNLSTLAADLWPPPKTRATGGLTVPLLPEQVMEEDEPVDPMQSEVAEGLGSPMAQLLVEQGRVLAALVSQMQAGSTDPMSDLSSTTPTMGVKGTLAREKMQRELAAGTGAFFLKVCQAIQRRVNPASRLATNLSEVGDVSLLGYLERYGGVWPESRAWYGSMVSRSRLRCHGQGRMESRARPPRPFCSDGGAGRFGLQPVESCLASEVVRRPAAEPFG